MKLLVDDLFEYTMRAEWGSHPTERYSDCEFFLEQIAADFELEAQKRHMAIEVSSETVTWCYLDAENGTCD